MMAEAAKRATGRDWQWIVYMLLFITAVHLRVMIGAGVYMHDDLSRLYLPMHSFAATELAQGRLTPWCGLVGCGYPFWATCENGTFYAPNLLFACGLPVGVAMGWLMWLHYCFAAIGMYLLARRLGCSRLGGFVAGLVFTGAGFMAVHLIHFSIVCAAAFLPWWWYGVLRWVRQRDAVGAGIIAGASACQLLAGHPQIWLLTFTSGLLLALMMGAGDTRRDGLRSAIMQAARAAGAPLLAAVVGAGLAGVQIVPMATLAGQSIRAGGSYEFASSYSLVWRHVRSLIDVERGISQNWEYVGFLGVGTVAVALLGAMRRGWRRTDLALWVLAVGALLMGMSALNPVYHVLWRLPMLGGFRCWSRWLLVYGGAISLLAGLGLTSLARDGGGDALRRVRLAAAIALAVFYFQWHLFTIPGMIIVNWAWLWDALPDSVAAYIIHNATLAIGLMWKPRTLMAIACPLIAAALIYPKWRGQPRRRWFVRALGGLMALEAVWFGGLYNSAMPPRELRWRHPELVLSDAEAGRIGLSDVWAVANKNVLRGVALTEVYGPLPLLRYGLLRARAGEFTDPNVAAIFGARWVATPATDSIAEAGEVVSPTQRFRLHANERYRGLAWPVFRVEPTAALDAVLDSGPEETTPLLEAAFLDEPGAVDLPTVEGAHGHATTAWEDGRGLGFDCETSAEGLLVIASTWYPGVSATVDGEPARVLRANAAFCAVPLPAGRHRVELIYRPYGLATGLLVTGICLLMLGIWVWARRRNNGR